MNDATKPRAILLVGPTGSGKTPLGMLLEERGLGQARCRHFDFGAQLRAIVEGGQPAEGFSRQEIDFFRRVLETGALLEDEHFCLAERILRAFLAQPGADGALVVLNGLPRHVGQARAVDGLLNVEAVICLGCTEEVVRERIRTNVGGDRTERRDDDPEAIRRKLRLFAERTAPLVEHYRARGARIEVIDVNATMTPDAMWRLLVGS